MVSKVFSLNLNRILVFLSLSILTWVSEKNILEAKNTYSKSYYGSILSGQIANYNNDSILSADFFNYANEINPRNIEIYNLTLMSLVISGDIQAAISKVKYYEENFGNKFNNSVIANFVSFINKVKSNKINQAFQHLNNNNAFLITEKMKPILKGWLLENLNDATEALNKYEYKSEGLALSNIYFHHLALIQNYHNNKDLSKKTFEKHLEVFDLDKLRTLFFYDNFLSANKNNKDNKYISLFLKKYADHSFSSYMNNQNRLPKIINTPSKGISEAFYNLAKTLYSQSMYETSLALAQTSLFLDPKNHIANYLVSLNLNSLGKKEIALEYLKKIPYQSYISWDALINLAELYMDLENYDLAEEYLHKLEKKYQNKIEISYKLGEMNHIRKKYDDAIKYFSDAISSLKEIDKKYWYLYYSRGMSYERSTKWELAEKDFLYALELSPDQPLTLNYLGYSWIDLGKNIDEAHKLITKAVKLRPNDGYFVDSLGWAYYRMGDYKKAVSELEKAVGLVPNDPIINDHLGDAMWRAGYKNEAVYQWNRALIYKPDNELKNKIEFKLKKGL